MVDSGLDASALTELCFELVGGLGIFLLGMKNMSDGMQAVAGSRLRRIIGSVTNNRIAATLVGIAVTCVVQSSSVTTVMVVGFVNRGVMGLSQAIGVVMGANIATPITGWILVLRIERFFIVAFRSAKVCFWRSFAERKTTLIYRSILKVGKDGLPLLGVATFVFLFSRSEPWRYWAMAILMGWLAELRDQDEPDKLLAGRLKHRERVLDSIQDEVSAFVTHFLAYAGCGIYDGS